MQRLKAQVKAGRLTLDEPTDLPEGEIVYPQAVDGLVLVDRDDVDVDERAALHAELEASITESDTGQTEDFAKFLSELRQQTR